MASVNRVILIGNLGADPELRYTANQTAVATLNLATTDYRTDKDGQKQQFTEWHRVVVWGRQAENVSKYLSKGRSCYIEGRLQTRAWEDKNGTKRYTTEIVAQTVQFLGGGRDQGTSASTHDGPPPHDDSSFNVGMGGDDSGLDEIPF